MDENKSYKILLGAVLIIVVAILGWFIISDDIDQSPQTPIVETSLLPNSLIFTPERSEAKVLESSANKEIVEISFPAQETTVDLIADAYKLELQDLSFNIVSEKREAQSVFIVAFKELESVSIAILQIDNSIRIQLIYSK